MSPTNLIGIMKYQNIICKLIVDRFILITTSLTISLMLTLSITFDNIINKYLN